MAIHLRSRVEKRKSTTTSRLSRLRAKMSKAGSLGAPKAASMTMYQRLPRWLRSKLLSQNGPVWSATPISYHAK